MQSLRPQTAPLIGEAAADAPFRHDAENGEGNTFPFAWSQAHADSAARVGFVLSMIFLATAALFGLALSARETTLTARLVNLVDEAVYNAGFRIGDAALLGVKNTPSHAIFEALNVPYSGSILSYDTSAARDRLLKLGWIETVELRRVFPARLEVAITERQPFALFEKEGKRLVIDREGRILGDDEEGRFATLLLTAGEGARSEAAALLEALAAHPGLKDKIERSELVAERFWEIKLASGLIVKLPRKVDGVTLNRVETMLANHKVAELDLATIDLRLPHRSVLQLRDATAANRDKAIATLVGAQQTSAAPQLSAPSGVHKGRPL